MWSVILRILPSAELSHTLAVFFLRALSGCIRFMGWVGISPYSQSGIEASSRLGLAAGFDKDAKFIEALPLFGFGFAEIGTVTPKAQPGNSKPRLFRLTADRALFNRMGFNNEGAEAASTRLRRAKKTIPPSFKVGVNLGKNKDTPNELAAQDYALAARPFEGLADYLVINVSSPNTPGLRDLQTPEALKSIIGSVRQVVSAWQIKPPLFLKIAPEIAQTNETLGPIIDACDADVDGWIATNTLGHEYLGMKGGLSGAPLTDQSSRTLRLLRQMTKKPVISVGGIMSAEDARDRIRAGADQVQIYTGWVYGGAFFPKKIRYTLDK